MHYSMVKLPCSNFRVITANVSGVRTFRIFTVSVSLVLTATRTWGRWDLVTAKILNHIIILIHISCSKKIGFIMRGQVLIATIVQTYLIEKILLSLDLNQCVNCMDKMIKIVYFLSCYDTNMHLMLVKKGKCNSTLFNFDLIKNRTRLWTLTFPTSGYGAVVGVLALQFKGRWFDPQLLQSFGRDYKWRSCLYEAVKTLTRRT